MIATLSPLFRYSPFRDAWVLRLIGERYGPVLLRSRPEVAVVDEVALAPARRWGRVFAGAPATLRSTLLLVAAVVVVVGAAVLGFALSRTSAGGSAAPALSSHASAGPLRLSVPADWHRVASPVAAQLGLTDDMALASGRTGSDVLVVGRSETPNPQLLPQALLAELAAVPTPQTATLGRMTFYRYLSLSPRGGPSAESVYALSTTIGTVLGVCIAPTRRVSFTSSCERSLATLTLSSGSALAPGPIMAYASALNQATKQLNDVRATADSQLRTAAGAQAEAQAANALAAAYGQAAAALAHVNAGPASAANSAVVAALLLNQTTYGAVGRAASLQRPAAYSTARASLAHAADSLTAAYAQLAAFGYQLS